MAPSPEYDKEPKAPDKSATNISSEDSKLLNNLVNDQHHNSDHKTTTTATNSEVENNKHVETLDDDKLRALLNEALTYKCPKDREGKSSLFKELLEEVEQDDQEACEAAARTLTGCRGSRRGVRGGGSRPALPHSNSLQDLVAALAAEPAPRRHHRHHAPPTVAARALHGGSLPSGVDTSSMVSEEGRCGGAGYLATVRCVNPPPLAERRVSASDANAPHDLEPFNRRSKPMFPMTYTARATLEIGSGSVCSGRAVTTTTASNQVRTSPHPPAGPAPATRLLSAICPDAGGGSVERGKTPRGPAPPRCDDTPPRYQHDVAAWYEGLAAYCPRRLVLPAPAASRRPPPRSRSGPATRAHGEPDRDTRAPQRKPKRNERYTGKNNKESLSTNLKYFDRRHSDDNSRRHGDINVHRVVERPKICDSGKSDISIRKTYREIKVSMVPRVPPMNPRNVRNMSIGEVSPSLGTVESPSGAERFTLDKIDRNSSKNVSYEVPLRLVESSAKEVLGNDYETNDARTHVENEISESMEDQRSKCFQMMSEVASESAKRAPGAAEPFHSDGIELEEIVCHRATKHNTDTGSFSNYLADQQKLFRVLEATDSNTPEDEYTVGAIENEPPNEREPARVVAREVSSERDSDMSSNTGEEEPRRDQLVRAVRLDDRPDRYILAELPNNAYIFLTLPGRAAAEPAPSDNYKRKKDKPPLGTSICAKRKDAIDKNALRALLFENLIKSDRGVSRAVGRAGAAPQSEVDSAIPFSCITTPEVVASCNTTASASHAALQPDSKPAGESESVDASAAAAAASHHAPPRADAPDEQPRSVVSSALNGLPLSRPSYPATATSSGDDYKKSIDENGNSVQGYGSPLSGSSQHKKPRRKKSSKNETVIDCRQLDGYQGDKDVNELLRFIESDRAPKLRKHKDDADDKGKKRAGERRKHHEHKAARASSLEELSRTTLEELTERAPCAKPERRSWGDAACPPAAAPPGEPPLPPATHEHADFQTVTKKRKPRRRTEEAAPRRARAPSPSHRPPASAPPSDRSNDSNDDMDSVHSMPERAPHHSAPLQPAHQPHSAASYADIARTRHNIPDLIESCNYYAEGEGEVRRHADPPAPPPAEPPPPADHYPALEPRVDPAPSAAARRPPRDKPAPPPARRKERSAAGGGPAGSTAPPPGECPAPDVVADRRPPVILLDCAVRPRDMDGVTFGFDINEQLLCGGARRPRCDLVRDAVEAPHAHTVRAAKHALRYVPPPPHTDHNHLTQIVDFVGTAWEDVVRCGGGKVRYFSE